MNANDIRASWKTLKQRYPSLTPWEHSTMHLGIAYREYAAILGMNKKDLSRAGAISDLFDLGEVWELEGNFMVVGDIHVPFTLWDMAVSVAQVAEKNMPAPRSLIIGGDFFNFDMFSTYSKLVASPEWKQERAAAENLLHVWMETFDKIWIIPGNHDRRMQKFTMGAFEIQDAISLVVSNPDRVRASAFGYCNVTSGGQRWRVTHPKNYSINQLVVADQVAQKLQMNLITFHEHHLAIGYDRYGRNIIVNGGCLVDQEKLTYVALDDSKSAGSIPGFVMLKNGTPTLFGEAPFTDWRLWL